MSDERPTPRRTVPAPPAMPQPESAPGLADLKPQAETMTAPLALAALPPSPDMPAPDLAAPDLAAPDLAAPVTVPLEAGRDKFFNARHTTLASIGASQAAIASDMTAIMLEWGGLTRASLTAAGDSAAALLRARNLADVVEIQLGFARQSIESLVGGSTRLGELGLRLANDAAVSLKSPFPAA